MKWTPRYPDLLIIANGKFPFFSLLEGLQSDRVTIVAVDGGVNFCAEANIIPDLIMGDFDSALPAVLEKYRDVPQLYAPNQDKSDLEKVLEFLSPSSMNKMTVWGATGGRVDQTLANICLLTRYPEKVIYEGEEDICFALCRKSRIDCQIGQRISLMPIGLVKEARSSGLKWELGGKEMDCHFFALSNVCMSETVEIVFQEGHLIVCLEKI